MTTCCRSIVHMPWEGSRVCGVSRGRSFSPESPFRYPVLHAGPRVCLGKEMAYIQMKLLAAIVIESFEFELVEDQPEHEVTMSQRMVGGLSVRVKEREA